MQFDFIVCYTELDNPGYFFGHPSAHNVPGYLDHEYDTSFLYRETYKYIYDNKGQPTQQNAPGGESGKTTTVGYFDIWIYECK